MKEVKILSSTYTIEYVKDRTFMDCADNYAECNYDSKMIRVAKSDGGELYSDKWLEESLHHELAHAFMYETGNSDLDDERHAELLGKFYDFMASLDG